jgi:hypothetical protein
MKNFEIDVELLIKKNIIDNDLRASIIENILKEIKIPFEKFYAHRDNRTHKKKEKVYMEEEETTIMYTFKCSEHYYDYVIYLFKKRAVDLERILKSYEA